MFDNAKDSGSRLPKPLKTSRRLIDSAFLQAFEAFKGAERRPTAQKGGAHAPPKSEVEIILVFDINASYKVQTLGPNVIYSFT